jgi:hypothetical protein
MKLTPFGFISQAESFLQDALSLPPTTGGKWNILRTVNFADHSSTLQVLILPESGTPRSTAIINARLTGGPKDGGIQGWADFPVTGSREIFVLKETNSNRSMEEIFEIVDRILSNINEWDQSAGLTRPEPPPRPAFEPLIPEIQTLTPSPAASASTDAPPAFGTEDSSAMDAQALVDSLLSGGSTNTPVESAPTEPTPEPSEPETVASESPKPEPLADETADPEAKPAKKTKAKKAAK